MLFDLLKFRNSNIDEGEVTGTYPDGAINLPATELSAARRNERERSAHERDYGVNRKAAAIPLGLV
ncbi:MAG: hypothetical protein QHC90_17730 [Shinella sp.]|nr:hypothetical protein [Shinella sp.]